MLWSWKIKNGSLIKGNWLKHSIDMTIFKASDFLLPNQVKIRFSKTIRSHYQSTLIRISLRLLLKHPTRAAWMRRILFTETPNSARHKYSEKSFSLSGARLCCFTPDCSIPHCLRARIADASLCTRKHTKLMFYSAPARFCFSPRRP